MVGAWEVKSSGDEPGLLCESVGVTKEMNLWLKRLGRQGLVVIWVTERKRPLMTSELSAWWLDTDGKWYFGDYWEHREASARERWNEQGLKGKQIGSTVSVVPSSPGIETRMGKLGRKLKMTLGGKIAPQM